MRPGETRAALEFRGPAAAEAWRRANEDDATDPLFATLGPEDGFSGRYVEGRVGEAIVADLRAQPLQLRDHAPANGPPVVLLQAVVDGRPAFRGADGELRGLRAGQVLVRPLDPAAMIRSDRFTRVTTLAIPRHMLVPRHTVAEALARGAVLEDGLPSRLLYALIAGLGEDEDGLQPQPAGFVDVVGALLALVLAQRPQPAVALSDLAATRAAAILDYLRRNFSNAQLDPQTLADDLSISVRYAHKLMRLTGRSFREALTALRLDAARESFAANARPRQTIADIAISVGFNDLSQFNRHFRAAYGMTPRAARRQDEAHGYEAGGAKALAEVDGSAAGSPVQALAPQGSAL